MSIRNLALLSCLVPATLLVLSGCAGNNNNNPSSPFPANSLIYHERTVDEGDDDSPFFAYSLSNGAITNVNIPGASQISQIAFRDDGVYFMYLVPATSNYEFRHATTYSSDLVGNSALLYSGTGTPPQFAVAQDGSRIILRFVKDNGNSELDDLVSGGLTQIPGLTDLPGTVQITGSTTQKLFAFKSNEAGDVNELHLLASDNTVTDVTASVGKVGQFGFGPLGDHLYALEGTSDTKKLYRYSLDLAVKTDLTPGVSDNFRSFVLNPAGTKVALSVKDSDNVTFWLTDGGGSTDAPITITRQDQASSIVFTDWTNP